MKLEEKITKIVFFENAIFGIFWVAKKSKKSNLEKCKNLLKRSQIFIAAYQRRVLNNIFEQPEPSRNLFFKSF